MSFFKRGTPAPPRGVHPGSIEWDLDAGETVRITEPIFELQVESGTVIRVNNELRADDPNYTTVLGPGRSIGVFGGADNWLFPLEPCVLFITGMAEHFAEEERRRRRAGMEPMYPPVGGRHA